MSIEQKIPGGKDVLMNVDPGEPGSMDGSSGIVQCEDKNEESDMDMEYNDAEDDWMSVLHGMRQSINNDHDALNKKVDEAIELLERIVAHHIAGKTAMKNRKQIVLSPVVAPHHITFIYASTLPLAAIINFTNCY